jgi:hypothetical protein
MQSLLSPRLCGVMQSSLSPRLCGVMQFLLSPRLCGVMQSLLSPCGVMQSLLSQSLCQFSSETQTDTILRVPFTTIDCGMFIIRLSIFLEPDFVAREHVAN